MRWPRWVLNGREWLLPRRALVIVEGESLPKDLPRRDLVLLRDAGEDWSVAMRCPCGCGQQVELALIPEAKPRWSLRLEYGKTPTLSPSVWLREGCRSHFFVRGGRVQWV
ncbi:MAG: DUF6527 family protein [Acidobacteriaceae bacterium]